MSHKILWVGRGELNKDGVKNDIQLSHPSISRSHLKVFIDDYGNVFVTDLSTLNGTFVNGNAVVGDVLLQPGDILKLGAGKPLQWDKWASVGKIEPEIEDLEKTDSNMLTKAAPSKKNNKKPIIIFSAILFIAFLLLAFYYYNASVDYYPKPSPSLSVLSKFDLENMNFADLKDSANKKPFVTDIKNEDQIITNDGKTVILTIEDGKLVAVKEKTIDNTIKQEPPPPPSKDDKDGDGVINSKDNCPTVKGDKSNNGCPKIITPTIKRNTNGTFSIETKADGESIKQLRVRIKYDVSISCAFPSDSEELRNINNNYNNIIIPADETQKIKGSIWITFKCH